MRWVRGYSMRTTWRYASSLMLSLLPYAPPCFLLCCEAPPVLALVWQLMCICCASCTVLSDIHLAGHTMHADASGEPPSLQTF